MKTLNDFTVSELMQRNICLVKESVPVLEALHLIEQKKVSSLIVEKEHAHDAYGILTQKDIVIEASENWETFPSLHVSDLSTKPVISIPSNVGVKHAIRLMRLSGVRRLIVFEGDKLAGVISNGDIFRKILELTKKPA
jgi:predicted transcriptional regulator